ncbi:hypothetical protein AK830_g5732 [Neonectria ditissima]|uniref:Uncharacterized protein n=1 Tax=Neonectria ditissima TaxID=78410 RepID=A0A0P7B485_9HYPO|nr:hypothetical protein AK830_g5732 [Neonectria ditissima]
MDYDDETIERAIYEPETVLNEVLVGYTDHDIACLEQNGQFDEAGWGFMSTSEDNTASASSSSQQRSEGLSNAASEPGTEQPLCIDPALLTLPSPETQVQEDPKPKKHQPPTLEELQANSDGTDAAQNMVLHAMHNRSLKCEGHIISREDAVSLRRAYNHLTARDGNQTSQPETDASFPQDDEQYRARIRQLHEAICDFSNSEEWRVRMGKKNVIAWLKEVTKLRRERGEDTDLAKVCDCDIAPPPEKMPSYLEQWKNVTGREASSIEIELICVEILSRILNGFRFNKMLIHSVMRSPWASRITNAPSFEDKRKKSNKTGNDRKRKAAKQGGANPKRARSESDE